MSFSWSRTYIATEWLIGLQTMLWNYPANLMYLMNRHIQLNVLHQPEPYCIRDYSVLKKLDVCMCVCACVCVFLHTYIYIHTHFFNPVLYGQIWTLGFDIHTVRVRFGVIVASKTKKGIRFLPITWHKYVDIIFYARIVLRTQRKNNTKKS